MNVGVQAGNIGREDGYGFGDGDELTRLGLGGSFAHGGSNIVHAESREQRAQGWRSRRWRARYFKKFARQSSRLRTGLSPDGTLGRGGVGGRLSRTSSPVYFICYSDSS